MLTTWKNDSPPEAPYFAVIFISRKGPQLDGYQETDERMMAEAQKQPGYLGYSSVSGSDGGIFISYWQNQESIDNWRRHSGHREAKGNARSWYDYYHSMICEVKSSKIFEKQWSARPQDAKKH